MRTTVSRHLDDPAGFRQCLLSWAQRYREVVFLDSNDFSRKHASFDYALAVDAFTSLRTDSSGAFDDLEEYRRTTADWIFGYLTYDLKNDVEDLESENHDGLQFPDLYFFQPKKLFLVSGHTVEVSYLRLCDDEIPGDWMEILTCSPQPGPQTGIPEIRDRISKTAYLEKVREMLRHIQRGDIYEANFCMEFYAENADINPLRVFHRLNAISGPPFACFLKVGKHFALCASPERFLRKTSDVIISQPIKGTAPRFDDAAADELSAIELSQNEKERAENIMITDLVRNDLSRSATRDSVEVEELCGVYSFPQVHHLVSTITSRLKPEVSPVQAIADCFPMGSMTGAPKISAMKIIESLEDTKRGLYSGSVGYFTPSGDFDFNVVIRSILYNADRRYLSFSTGSAITSLSDPEKEYAECLLKAAAMRKVLQDEGL